MEVFCKSEEKRKRGGEEANKQQKQQKQQKHHWFQNENNEFDVVIFDFVYPSFSFPFLLFGSSSFLT